MTTLAVYSFNLLNLSEPTNDITMMLDKVDAAAPSSVTTANKDATARAVGTILGKIFTKIFNVQVPDVQYQVYNWDWNHFIITILISLVWLPL